MSKFQVITLKCKGCAKVKTRRVYRQVAKFALYCNDCKDGVAWRKKNKSYMGKYNKKYTPLTFRKNGVLYGNCLKCHHKKKVND